MPLGAAQSPRSPAPPQLPSSLAGSGSSCQLPAPKPQALAPPGVRGVDAVGDDMMVA